MRSKRQPVAVGSNGSALIQPIFRTPVGRTLAIGCAPWVPYLFHRNRPVGAGPTRNVVLVDGRVTSTTRPPMRAAARLLRREGARLMKRRSHLLGDAAAQLVL
jgi:hypothetical protein